LLAALPARFASVTPLSHGRVAVRLAPHEEPDRVIGTLRGEGARLESLNPLRLTLEDFFIQHVRDAQPRATGL
jgi:hypothetical protein